MRYFVILISMFLLMAATCSKQGANVLKSSKANKYLLGSDDAIKLQFVSMYDPYNGGQTIKAEEDNPKFIVFNNDGTYKKYDSANKAHGKWYINSSKDSIAFVVAESNGTVIPEADQQISFRHKLKEVSNSKVVMTWQGRHGYVDETYKVIK